MTTLVAHLLGWLPYFTFFNKPVTMAMMCPPTKYYDLSVLDRVKQEILSPFPRSADMFNSFYTIHDNWSIGERCEFFFLKMLQQFYLLYVWFFFFFCFLIYTGQMAFFQKSRQLVHCRMVVELDISYNSDWRRIWLHQYHPWLTFA